MRVSACVSEFVMCDTFVIVRVWHLLCLYAIGCVCLCSFDCVVSLCVGLIFVCDCCVCFCVIVCIVL